MNPWARSLALLAVAGHFALQDAHLQDAHARSSGATGAPGGHGSVGTANGGHVGAVGIGANNGGRFGVSGINGGQVGAVGQFGGRIGAIGAYGDGRGNPAPAPSQSSGFPFFGFEAASGACGLQLQLFDPGDFANPVDRVAAISEQTQSFVNTCSCNTQDCVADALDAYASALEQIDTPPPPERGFAPLPPRRLPREFRDLPNLVHEAADRVRKASTPHAAVKALQAVVEIVQKRTDKTIALMRASDSDAGVVATRGPDLIADTLAAAADALTRADSL